MTATETRMITLTNDFHNTSVRIRATDGDAVSKATVQRVRKALCCKDCTCSGVDGTRGSDYRIEEVSQGQFRVTGPS
jgi:hypothetical protein